MITDNKNNHPISSSSNPSATAKKQDTASNKRAGFTSKIEVPRDVRNSKGP